MDFGTISVAESFYLGQQPFVTPVQVNVATPGVGGIGLLSGPIFVGTVIPGQLEVASKTGLLNLVPSVPLKPFAFTISSDGLGDVVYPGIGLYVNALQHVITSEFTSTITVTPPNISLIAPTTTVISNELHVGTYDQFGANAQAGAKADVGVRVEANVASELVDLYVASHIYSGVAVDAPIITAGAFFGDISACSGKKDFDIQHPTKKGWRLRHVCVEGPTADVYVRGTLKDSNIIDLPEYWKGLVDPETITIHFTSVGCYQELYLEKIEYGSRVIIKNSSGGPINCQYIIYGERKDVEKNIPEYEGSDRKDYPGNNDEYMNSIKYIVVEK